MYVTQQMTFPAHNTYIFSDQITLLFLIIILNRKFKKNIVNHCTTTSADEQKPHLAHLMFFMISDVHCLPKSINWGKGSCTDTLPYSDFPGLFWKWDDTYQETRSYKQGQILSFTSGPSYLLEIRNSMSFKCALRPAGQLSARKWGLGQGCGAQVMVTMP